MTTPARPRYRDHHRALGIRLEPPDLETGRGSFKCRFELFVADLLELLLDFAGGGIDALIAHKRDYRPRHAGATWGVNPMVMILN